MNRFENEILFKSSDIKNNPDFFIFQLKDNNDNSFLTVNIWKYNCDIIL